MSEPLRCASCGLPLDPPGPGGLCPICLLRMGVEAAEGPDRVSQALVGVGSLWPAVFSGGASYSLADGVRVADGAVFDGHRKVAGLAEVVQRTPREDASEIRVAGQQKGDKRMAALGAGAGLLVGAYVGFSMSDKDCGSGCSDEKALIGLSVIGLPIALGVLGYYGGSHTVGGMIYRATATAGSPPSPSAGAPASPQAGIRPEA